MFRLPGLLAGFALVAATSLPIAATAQQTPSGEPIKIGFGMGLTGGLASAGKAALLGIKIWEEEINAKGGLLGRPVKLIYYDDQSSPATVPGIYTKLLEVDKVDIVASDYGTNLIAPAMPIMIQKGEDLLFAVRPRRQQGIPIPEILLDAAGRRGRPAGELFEGIFRAGGAAEPEAANRRDHRRGRRIPAQRRRGGAQEREGMRVSRSFTTRPIRRTRPTTRRSCVRSMRPAPISSSAFPIRPTRSGWCAPRTRSG